MAPGGPRWDFGGHKFTQSGAVAAVGAVALVTAPLSVPSNAVFGAGVAITHGLSLLAGTPGEVARALGQEDFLARYGLRREELKWSVVPVSTLFWDLRAGDSLLELCLKAKRGPLGAADLSDSTDSIVQLKLRRLLCRLLDCMPGTAAEKASRLDHAIRKAAVDMGLEPLDGSEISKSASRLDKAFRTAAAELGHPEVSAHLEEIGRDRMVHSA